MDKVGDDNEISANLETIRINFFPIGEKAVANRRSACLDVETPHQKKTLTVT